MAKGCTESSLLSLIVLYIYNG